MASRPSQGMSVTQAKDKVKECKPSDRGTLLAFLNALRDEDLQNLDCTEDAPVVCDYLRELREQQRSTGVAQSSAQAGEMCGSDFENAEAKRRRGNPTDSGAWLVNYVAPPFEGAMPTTARALLDILVQPVCIPLTQHKCEELLKDDSSLQPLVVVAEGELATQCAGLVATWGRLVVSGPKEVYYSAKVTIPLCELHQLFTQLMQSSSSLPGFKTVYNAATHVDTTVKSPQGSKVADASERATTHMEARRRPDAAEVVERLLMLVWEDKQADDMPAAVNDLKVKLAGSLPFIYYQGIEFMVVAATAGNLVDFGLCNASGKVTMCNQPYDVRRPADALRLIGAMVQLYRLLRAARKLAPVHASMLAMGVEHERPRHTLIHLSKSSVVKQIHNFEEGYRVPYGIVLKHLQAAYQLGESCPYLPKLLADRPRVKSVGTKRLWPVLHQPVTDGTSIYEVLLDPSSLGYAVSCDELDMTGAQRSMLCLLRALAALHAARPSLVHRDVRWENVLVCMRNKQLYYKLSDLEMVDQANKKPTIAMTPDTMTAWDHQTLERNGKYAARGDIYSLGRMLQQWQQQLGHTLDADGVDFLAGLTATAPAAAALQEHAWLATARCHMPGGVNGW